MLKKLDHVPVPDASQKKAPTTKRAHYQFLDLKISRTSSQIINDDHRQPQQWVRFDYPPSKIASDGMYLCDGILNVERLRGSARRVIAGA